MESKKIWEKKNCGEDGRLRLVGGAGQGGVSNVTLMNQCQWSAKKIIKKQASALLNTAKGKKLVLLYAKRLEGKKE